MAGILVCIVPPTTFDFTRLQGVANTGIAFPLAQRIDVSGYETGVLQVRTHARSFANANDEIDIVAAPHGFTPDDPSTDFNTVLPSATTVTIAQSSASPDFVHAGLSIVSGLYQVLVRGIRGGTSTGSLLARVSVELLLRTRATVAAPRGRFSGVFTGYR